MNFFLNEDAYLNYFSEFLGILVTILLIPVFVKYHNKYWTKRKIANMILVQKINNALEKVVPKKFRDSKNGTVWIKKHPYKSKIIIFDFILPFTVKTNKHDSIINFYVRKFENDSSNRLKNIKKKYKELIKVKEDLENVFFIYGNVVEKSIFREFYKLDLNIQTIDTEFDKYDNDDILFFLKLCRLRLELWII